MFIPDKIIFALIKMFYKIPTFRLYFVKRLRYIPTQLDNVLHIDLKNVEQILGNLLSFAKDQNSGIPCLMILNLTQQQTALRSS